MKRKIAQSKYKKLNDRQWLYEHYIDKKLGTKKICKLAGAKTPNSVRQSLIRFNMPLRSISEGLTCNREDDGFIFDQEILNGCLLGDGFLRSYNKKSDHSYPYFSKRNIHYDHVLFVADQIFSNNHEKRIQESSELFLGKYRTIFQLRTLSHKKLLRYFREWYPPNKNYKKTIPDSLVLTPTVLLHWFLDDGCSYRRKRKTRQIIITFCSECFSLQEQNKIQEQFQSRFGIKTWLHETKSGHRIEMSQSYADKFYNVVGRCPVPSMAYKWK
jgi:hypothetical protein